MIIVVINKIKALEQSAQLLAENQLDNAIVVDRQDELGVLQQAFEDMRVSLKDFIENLDQKVEEKTQEVTKAMQKIEKGMKELEGEGMDGIFESLEKSTEFVGVEVSKIQDRIFDVQDLINQLQPHINESEKETLDGVLVGVNEVISLTMMGDLSTQKLDNVTRQLKELRNYVLALLGEEGEDLSGINFDHRIDKVGVEDEELDIDALLMQYGT